MQMQAHIGLLYFVKKNGNKMELSGNKNIKANIF